MQVMEQSIIAHYMSDDHTLEFLLHQACPGIGGWGAADRPAEAVFRGFSDSVSATREDTCPADTR